MIVSSAYAMGLGNEAPVISSVTANPNPVVPGGQSTLTCTASDPDGEITQYEWTADGGTFPSGGTTETIAAPENSVLWTAPQQTGYYNITITVYDTGSPYGGGPATATAYLTILVSGDNNAPIITSLIAETDSVFLGGSIFIVASATDPDADPLSYQWSASGGTITQDNDADPEAVVWTTPQVGGQYLITVTVTDGRGGQSTASVSLNAIIGREAGFVRTPYANPVRIDSDGLGQVYVSDTHKKRVLGYSPDGSQVLQIEGLGNPLGICVSPGGKLYIGEESAHRVSIYTTSGSFLGVLNGPPIQMPNSIDMDPTAGRIFVCDTKGKQILVFDITGTFLYSFDGSSAAPGGFIFPVGVAVYPATQTVYVTDGGSYQVLAFDYLGNYKFKFGSVGKGPGKFTRPQGVAVDDQGRIFVVDTYQSYAEVFDSSGQYLATVGTFGLAKGSLSIPLDVDIDSLNRLLVTSNDNSRVEVYGLSDDVVPLPNVAPTEPTLYLPVDGAQVQEYNPTLVLQPASDADGDVLTYDFEVYEMDALDPYASVDGVPETSGEISWSVTPPLHENVFYEWTARASDGIASSQWTPYHAFYVNAVNETPAVPAEILVSPGTELRPGDSLAWSASTDPDALDQVSYILEIDDNPDFSSVLVRQTNIQATSISIESLEQYDQLVDDTLYYWRVRAVDNRGAESDWISGSFYFNRIEIEVSSDPDGATVYIDGSPAYPGWKAGPETTPIIVKNVSETRHIVTLKKADQGSQFFIADNRNGADAQITASLHPAAPVSVSSPVTIPPDLLSQDGPIYLTRPFLVDWNFDGALDLLLGDSSGTVRLIFGGDLPSYGGILLDPATVFGTQATNGAVFAVDWDDDADFDLLVGTGQGTIRLARNEGTQEAPAFVDGGAIQILGQDLVFGYDSVPAVVDWNEDGKKDLLVGSSSGKIGLYINVGTDEAPEFAAEEVLTIQGTQLVVPDGYSVPFVTDWNNDGMNDLLAGSRNGQVYLYLNIGTPGSPVLQAQGALIYYLNKNKTDQVNAGSYSTPYLADWDGDGLRDLLSGNDNGEVVVFQGTQIGK